MITVHDLHHHIGSKAILQHINLELAPGGIIALIGPNGAGKSTLLAHIASPRDSAGKSRWIPSTSPPATATISRANWQYCNNKPAS